MLSPECPVQFLFRTSAGSDVDGEKELLKVDIAVVVRVERPESNKKIEIIGRCCCIEYSLCEGKYHCAADLLFHWFGFYQNK